MNKTSIAIIGVDGSGKSETVKQLTASLTSSVAVFYMGEGNHYYVTDIAKRRFKKRKEQKKSNSKQKRYDKLINAFIYLNEMWKRVRISHESNAEVVIYDRYAWDLYLGQKGFQKLVSKILFYYLFPRPDYVFYLRCPTEISLKRKTDIVNIENFIRTKERYDNELLGKKNIYAINTDSNSIETVIDMIKLVAKLKET